MDETLLAKHNRNDLNTMARMANLLVLLVAFGACMGAHGSPTPCPRTMAMMAAVPKPMSMRPTVVAAVVLPAKAPARPQFPTILAAAEAGKLNTLIAAIKAAGPALVAPVTTGTTAVTVFAPTDAAFAALLKKLGTTAEALLANKPLLTRVLQYHIVPVVATSSQLTNGQTLPTLLTGKTLTARVGMGKVRIIGGDVTANVVMPNLTAGRSVVHVIDAVLVPK